MKYILFIICIVPFAVNAQKNFTITGNVEGLKEGTPVSLTTLGETADTIAKARAKAGKFVLMGKLNEPSLSSLNFKGFTKKIVFFVENSNISITGDTKENSKSTITGSVSQKDYEQMHTIFDPVFERYAKLQKKANDSGVTASVKEEAMALNGEFKSKTDAFVGQYNNSFVTPLLLLQFKDDIEMTEQQFNRLTPAVQQSVYGKYIRQSIDAAKVGAVGTKAIDFTQNDTEGKPVSLSQFKGKYVLVDFWASWCAPCRQENPNVVKQYNIYKSKGLNILGISLDVDKRLWEQAIKKDGLSWNHASDLKNFNGPTEVLYHIEAIPSNFMIDPQGNIVAKNITGSDLEEFLNKTFNKAQL